MRFIAGVLAVAAAAVLTASCGTSPPQPATPTGPPPVPTAPPPAAAAHIGSACGFIPVHGAGSFGSMSSSRAVAAARSNPQLSVFSSAIKSAALTAELDKMHGFTLFIPVNSAFAALSKPEVKYLRDHSNLIKVVRRQIVPARVTPAQISRGRTVVSLAGSKLALAKAGTAYRVDAATVLCGNIRTANGTIYVIDKVLLPPR